MILKTFQVALLSFLLFIIPSVIVEKYNEFKEHDSSYMLQVIFQIFFYGIPLFGLGFVILLLINKTLESLVRDKILGKQNRIYFVISTTIATLPILGFILFDISQCDRFFPPNNTISSVFTKYSVLFVWVIIAIFLNRKIVWKNFENV